MHLNSSAAVMTAGNRWLPELAQAQHAGGAQQGAAHEGAARVHRGGEEDPEKTARRPQRPCEDRKDRAGIVFEYYQVHIVQYGMYI